MNYFHADSSERVHTLLSTPLLPDIIPLSSPSFFIFWVEMTGAREEGKGGDRLDGGREERRRQDERGGEMNKSEARTNPEKKERGEERMYFYVREKKGGEEEIGQGQGEENGCRQHKKLRGGKEM